MKKKTPAQDDYFRLLFKDHLGSTRSVVRVALPEGGQWEYNWYALAFYDYDPYGKISGQWEYGGSVSYKYSGKERHGAGHDYFGARYYDGQNLAYRWISADPLGAHIYDPPSLNKYSYVRDDPVNLVDPDGLDPQQAQPIVIPGLTYSVTVTAHSVPLSTVALGTSLNLQSISVSIQERKGKAGGQGRNSGENSGQAANGRVGIGF